MRAKVSVVIAVALGAQVLASIGGPVPVGAEAARVSVESDFDGDGFGDLAVGVPGETVSGQTGAGAVNVIYGSLDGLTAARNQFWHQDSPGILEELNESDNFGGALSSGDFDGDGFADLAIASTSEDLPGAEGGGAVNVLYGSEGGLAADSNQLWHQDSPGVLGVAGPTEWLGSSLASGDLNGDGFADLAMGVPEEDDDAGGAVNVLYGSSGGLTADGNQLWTQDSPGILDSAESGDAFGHSLASGDFDGDGVADLAVGAVKELLGGIGQAGLVNVLYGSQGGLAADGNQVWTQGSPGIVDDIEDFDEFGWSLEAGDFDGSGFADLVVGLRWENVAEENDGAVNVIYGSPDGLASAGNQFWHQDKPGVRDLAEPQDEFGFSVASGDFDGDGMEDLAIGVPHEAVARVLLAGAVQVLYGSPLGLSAERNQLWAQATQGVVGESEFDENLGTSVVALDLGGGSTSDLAIGVPREGLGGATWAGAVNVLYGSVGGLSADGDQFWSQGAPGIADVPESNDVFGSLGC